MEDKREEDLDTIVDETVGQEGPIEETAIPPPAPPSAQVLEQMQLMQQLDPALAGIPIETGPTGPEDAPTGLPEAPAPEGPTPEGTAIVPIAEPAEPAGQYERPPAYPQSINGQQARKLAAHLIHTFFTTQLNPLTRHHIESYDQFIERDLREIIAARNPMTLLKNPKARQGARDYMYKVQVWIGGPNSQNIYIGTPTITLQQGEEVRALFPNEARLRNMTYAVQIQADVLVRITRKVVPTEENPNPELTEEFTISKMPLFNMPLMLHSRYCMLSGKPKSLLQEMGECTQDPGGYFIVDGSEKVLVTRQEGSFNTLWITEQRADPNIHYYASIQCLHPRSREVRRVGFYWSREQKRAPPGFGGGPPIYMPSVLEVSLPLVLKPVPVFVVFRALGLQTDEEIMHQIFPDFSSPEAQVLSDLLLPSCNQASPFLDSYTAIQYIKSLTKGFSIEHVLDILRNKTFTHVENRPGARIAFLADCVRKILRVVKKLDEPASRDDTRNQRLKTSGFLIQELFRYSYETYLKKVRNTIEETYAYNESIYSDENFKNIFQEANRRNVFAYGFLTENIMRGFKGKWITGANQDQTGVLQELSRLSYLDFVSHLRHAVLNFDTGMKLARPRRLDLTQYGYFCPSETPSGASIGITKNLTIMTAISTAIYPDKFIQWLVERGSVIRCEHMTPELATRRIPVYVNSGIVGYTQAPRLLTRVLRLMKRGGFLPPFSSSGFSIPEQKIFVYLDEGRPLRPFIICEENGEYGHLPSIERLQRNTWREYVVGFLRPETGIASREFIDPLADEPSVKLESYAKYFTDNEHKLGVIEYLDPYEQNEILLANYPEHVFKETTHMEVHPSTILGLLGNMIPYPNHNQSPRNQLSASQSKQGLSIYATNWPNRFDNTANVLCYGEAPIARTIYQDYIGDGIMSYGQNIILAMGIFTGYNQEDGIIVNGDALARGQFRSLNYRSYESFEEDDTLANIKYRIGNPNQIPGWTDLKPLDYSKLDSNGIVKVGEFVDQNTVIVGRMMITERGEMSDASKTPQVWTRGRVENVVVTVNPAGLRLVKVRIVQDRVPEVGDKFSNRHGQKGTINVILRGHDMPRTAEGITPDMIMNPSALASRMTIGQILEMIFGYVAAEFGGIANTTAFMNDGSPHELLGEVLEGMGLNRVCNQVLYSGSTGHQIQADVFMGVVYGMRLKHMTEDKWNARGEGRREQRTHQPTGGRGNEGGMKLGEMERDAILAHGVSAFQNESYMKRSDGTTLMVCNGCGTIPIYNEKQNLYLCTMCDGPIQYSSDKANNLEPIPPPVRSGVTFSKVQFPYATKLFLQELQTFANIGTRILTSHDVTKFKSMESVRELMKAKAQVDVPLRPYVPREVEVPEEAPYVPAPTAADIAQELAALNDRAVQGFQQEAQAMATERFNGQAPTALAQEATNIIQGLTTQANQQAPTGQIPQVQPNPMQPTNQLVPLPQPIGQPPMNQPMQGTNQPTTVTQEGVPVFNIDTSEDALRSIGLVEPRDSRQPVGPPPPQYQGQNVQPMTRRRPRSRSQGQQGGYNSYNSYDAYAPQDEYQQEAMQQQQQAPKTYITGMKIEKLG